MIAAGFLPAMKTTILQANLEGSVAHAVDVLKEGGVVAFPTDTVYGLGALAYNTESLKRIYNIKGREHNKAIAILIANTDQLEQIALDPKDEIYKLARRFWPGPLTMVLERHTELPELLAPNHTIGVRVPDHNVALELLEAAGPMAVTSANLSGEENANTAEAVEQQLAGRVHLILDGGKTPGGVPSTVVDLTQSLPTLLREGPIGEAEILASLA
jgi:L-threonylcarbamoyladenylate synthase